MTAAPVLHQYTPTSFYAGDTRALLTWLEQRDWRQVPNRNDQTELARLGTADGALLVVYCSGTVLPQGQYIARTRALLATLVPQPAAIQEVLPW